MSDDPPKPTDRTNWVGLAGFLLALCGLASIATVSFVAPVNPSAALAIALLTCASIPGAILSLIGMLWTPRQLAAWGLFLGILGMLYLPTIFLPLMRN